MKILHTKKVYITILILILASMQSFALDYYWVGGTGNYSDISHWATTSGGSVKYSLPPTSSDNVFFDANSGFTTSTRTVTIDINSFCHNMTWQGVPTVNAPILSSAGSKNMDISGSLILSPGMTIGNSSLTLLFSASQPAQTITTNGVALFNVTFQGTGGWVLMDDLTVGPTYIMTFNSGILDLNGKTVACGTFSSGSTLSRTLMMPGATINTRSGFTYNGANSNVMTDTETFGSLITLITGNLITKTNDKYYNVEALSVPNSVSVTSGRYNKITMLTVSGTLSSVTPVTTDTLILSSNGNFSFGNFSLTNPTTINKYFSATPSSPCGGIIDLSGSPINMGASAIINVINARLKNFATTGSGAPYTAVSSIDLGGNTGWNIDPIATRNTFYWVGGSGNWTDQNHWAINSGGTPGSGCIPTPYDNVVFDDNSGFVNPSNRTITSNVNAYCDSMSWKGSLVAPILSNSGVLEVSGSLYLQRGMTIGGQLFMASDRLNEKINFNGAVPSGTLNFKSQSGSGGWDLQDSLVISNVSTINFIRGNLNFNGQYVSGYSFQSSGNFGDYYLSRTLNIANSKIVLASQWNYFGGSPLDAAHSVNSLIRLSGNIMNAKVGDVYYNVELTATNTINNGIYNKITYFSNAGTLQGTITTDSLVFQNVGDFKFATNPTINKYLATKQSCGGMTNLLSDNTSERTITMGNPSQVVVSNAQISYLSITGPGVPYLIVNSIKQAGIDAGWDFGAIISNKYYWVGGTGNWNDAAHWSTASGLQNGSGCVPTPFDQVIFDDNSFSVSLQQVTVDGNAYCDSMSWIGNGAFTLRPVLMVTNPLQVNGSLLLQRGMIALTTGTLGTLTLAGSRAGESITSNGVNIASYLFFNGTGEWLLRDSLNSSGIVNFINGRLNFNGQYARIYGFSSQSSTNPTRTLNIANSTIDIYGTGNWSYVGGAPLTVERTANSLIKITNTTINSFIANTGDIYNNLEITGGPTNSTYVGRGTYNRLEFKIANGSMESVTADTLIFAPGGRNYTFVAAATTEIKEAWITNGTPCLPTTIQSTTSALANVSMPMTAANEQPDTVLVDFIRLRYINAVTGPDRAIMKKGGQSVDDSGYGLSGNNTNWVIIPYAGPSHFTGLGPDVAEGCTDFPYTLQLEATYKPGSVGSYEWRQNDISGAILGTGQQLNVSAPGTYFLTVSYDAAKTCNLTGTKVVLASADTLIWTGAASDSDWNNPANWKKPDGTSDVTTVPRGCSNITIPAGISTYPILDLAHTNRIDYPNVACGNIHFASGAEVAYTDSLHYDKAFVELATQRDRWYMLSAPLQNMYSGDYWLAPLGVNPTDPVNYNRNNPRIYMQQYQIQNPETGYSPGEANWSRPFNTLDVPMKLGLGYVVGIDGAGTDRTYLFPRPENRFEYFNRETGLPNGRYTPVLDRSKSNRLYLEPGFSGTIAVDWDSTSRSTIILGNPFMSHLSFSALRAGNPGVFGTTYYVWTNTSFDAFTVIGDQSTKTDWTSSTIEQIAPMQSFILEKLVPASVITNVNVTSSMSVTAPGVPLRSHHEEVSALNMEVYRSGQRQSAATLITGDGKSVPTLFSSTVKEPAVVYFGSADKAYSILASDLETPVELGIRSIVTGSLTFKLQGTESLPSGTTLYLEDLLTGSLQDMKVKPEYTFNNETGNIQGRFFLKVSNNGTALDDINLNSGIRVYTAGNSIHVNADGDLIQTIEIFNMQGEMIYKQSDLGVQRYSFEPGIMRQVIIAKVTTMKDSKTEKLLLK